MSLDDNQTPAEIIEDIDPTKVDTSEELLEGEVVDVIDLLADEPSEDEPVDSEEELEIAQLMDPYGINDY